VLCCADVAGLKSSACRLKCRPAAVGADGRRPRGGEPRMLSCPSAVGPPRASVTPTGADHRVA